MDNVSRKILTLGRPRGLVPVKSAAQRMREYRQRKKEQNRLLSNNINSDRTEPIQVPEPLLVNNDPVIIAGLSYIDNPSTSSVTHHNNESFSNIDSPNAEDHVDIINPLITEHRKEQPMPAKSAAQRMREYRQRKKERNRLLKNSINNTDRIQPMQVPQPLVDIYPVIIAEQSYINNPSDSSVKHHNNESFGNIDPLNNEDRIDMIDDRELPILGRPRKLVPAKNTDQIEPMEVPKPLGGPSYINNASTLSVGHDNNESLQYTTNYYQSHEVKECKEKWKNIRTVFRRHLPSPTGVPPKNNYYLHNELQFLMPIISSSSSKKSSSSIVHNDSQMEILEVKVENEEIPEEQDPLQTYSSDVDTLQPEVNQLEQIENRQFTESMDTFSTENNCQKIEETISNRSSSSEADEQFLLSLKWDLGEMNSKQKRLFKKGVYDLIDKIMESAS